MTQEMLLDGNNYEKTEEFSGYEIPQFSKKNMRATNGIVTFVFCNNGKRMELNNHAQKILNIKNQKVYVSCNLIEGKVVFSGDKLSSQFRELELKKVGSKLVYYCAGLVELISSILNLSYKDKVSNTITNYTLDKYNNIPYVVLNRMEEHEYGNEDY